MCDAGTPIVWAIAVNHAAVPSTPYGYGDSTTVAPRACSARTVSPTNGCANSSRVFAPTAGNAVARRGGKNDTGPTPS